jgi:hypothetical protein
MSEAYKSLIIKILIGLLSAGAAALHLQGGDAYLPAIAADLVDLAVAGYGFYRTSGMKLVPHSSVAISKDNVLTTENPIGSHAIVGTDDKTSVAVKVVGAILLSLFIQADWCQPSRAATATASCNLLTLMSGITASNFIQRLQSCGDADIKAALDDANTAPIDNGALACFIPLEGVISAIKVQEAGNAGLITAMQKFRRAKQSGFVGACTAWVNTTIALQ